MSTTSADMAYRTKYRPRRDGSCRVRFISVRIHKAATMGALNCFAMAGLYSTFPALATAEMWMVLPESVRIILTGEMPKRDTRKGHLLPGPSRPSLGAVTSLFEPVQRLLDYLRPR